MSPKWSLTMILVLVFHLIFVALVSAQLEPGAVVYMFPFGTGDQRYHASRGMIEAIVALLVSIILVWRTRWEE
ncbi:hypothetical protein Tmar_0560 [Thermaerobacter marianensis DSM 12885]|uniref:Uncharacterized protein n=1 Tax=Thermaerobacter marianensis (strain ATCC 700841 / DSM 12885 / JCM 10246 / 7p75a) TaxID=644966 RepID=E6SHB7_THEM7|nr:hypothetical protein [Thermaerobacter marianensis]ADU50681.1 hypothetical protein Tmar_0560 [Thermaerobacter marianensis DSM 12885]